MPPSPVLLTQRSLRAPQTGSRSSQAASSTSTPAAPTPAAAPNETDASAPEPPPLRPRKPRPRLHLRRRRCRTHRGRRSTHQGRSYRTRCGVLPNALIGSQPLRGVQPCCDDPPPARHYSHRRWPSKWCRLRSALLLLGAGPALFQPRRCQLRRLHESRQMHLRRRGTAITPTAAGALPTWRVGRQRRGLPDLHRQRPLRQPRRLYPGVCHRRGGRQPNRHHPEERPAGRRKRAPRKRPPLLLCRELAAQMERRYQHR